MRFYIPIQLPSLTNLRLHWRNESSLRKKQKEMTARALRTCSEPTPTPPLLVTITRVGPRKLDDDNLAAACKHVRDQIADAVGIDDGSNQYTWRYEQRIGKYGVDVEITSR